MAKKISVVVLAFLSAMLWLGKPLVEAAPQLVEVSGEAKSGDLKNAVEDARRNAVKEVLNFLLSPQQEAYQRILQDYRSYTLEKADVTDKEKKGNTLYIVASVMVDVDKIRADLQRSAAAAQEKHFDSTAVFLVRVKCDGMSPAFIDKAQQEVQQTFKAAFMNAGFASPESVEGALQQMNQYAALPYLEYKQKMLALIQQDYVEVPVAVIGEVEITGADEGMGSAVRNGRVRFASYDMFRNGAPIADYEDSYMVRTSQNNQGGLARADVAILQKSAVNGARALAGQTLEKWQGKKARE